MTTEGVRSWAALFAKRSLFCHPESRRDEGSRPDLYGSHHLSTLLDYIYTVNWDCFGLLLQTSQ